MKEIGERAPHDLGASPAERRFSLRVPLAEGAGRADAEKSVEGSLHNQAVALLAETSETSGRKLVIRTFADRDIKFLKLLAQRLTRLAPNTVAALGTTSPQPSLVFAQSTGQPFDMGSLMKETMAKHGGRGGGSKDMAQGGLPNAEAIPLALGNISAALKG